MEKIKKRKALGKGISALLGDITEDTAKEKLEEIDIDKIVPNPEQPRTHFENIDDLTNSIKNYGVLQPIILLKKNDKYQIIAGERRWRAAKKAGLKTIPAIVKSNISDSSNLEIALIENIQRENLDPVDEAKAYRFLIEKWNISIEELAKKLGKNRSTISNSLRLLTLPEEILQDLKNGTLTPGQVRPIIGIKNKKDLLKIKNTIISKKLNAREVEKLAKNIKKGKFSAARQNSYLNDLSQKLQNKFGTKVLISGSVKKGKITFEYYSEEDLERILDLLNL